MDRSMIGQEIGSELQEAGVVPKDLKITRIIIDIPVNKVVKVYYETVGEKSKLDSILNKIIENKDKIVTIDLTKISRIERVKEIIKESLESHVKWSEYYKKHPEEIGKHDDEAGSVEHQNYCIEKYKEALEILTDDG